jgi:hypothetical protein
MLAAGVALLATPLVIPHANQHEAILGGLGVILLLAAARERTRFRPLGAAAIGTHAVLWGGPMLGGEASAWLLFGLLMAWLATAVWLTRD